MATLKTTRGLVTFPNEVNKAEGALEIADNAVINAENIIESRRGFKEFGTELTDLDDRVKQLLQYKGRIFRHFDSVLQFDSDGNGTFSQFDGTYNEINSGKRIRSQEANGNFYFTTEEGVKKISATNASQFTSSPGYITQAGGVKALSIDVGLSFSSTGYIPPQSKVAYRTLWGIKDTNNNVILGTPSERFVVSNTSEDLNLAEQFELLHTSNNPSDYDGTTDDRYVLFSSANQDYFLYFTTTANPDAPEDGPTIGRQPIEVNIDGLSSASDIATATGSALGQLPNEFSVEINSATVIVTSLDEGTDVIDASSSTNLPSVVTTITRQGSTTAGNNANGEITIVVPPEIDNVNYFYQLYRTAPITAVEGLSLEDIDPGDEMNLVFEANLTEAQILAGEVTFIDTTTEAFRASGAFLYTNPNTGQGILQANERPPLAEDIALFRNTTFYGNTKTVHRLQMNLLSVDDLTSGFSTFIIGNSNSTAEYVFVGNPETTDITTDSFANTDDTGYIFINGANNTNKYYIWFDKGGTVDPGIQDRIGIRVELTSGDTDAQVATKLNDSLNLISDFIATVNTNVVTVKTSRNGNVTDATIDQPLTGTWAVAVTDQGDGEDVNNNEVLLSGFASVGLAIDETARSLVKIINKDINSPVNAFYLSGENDVPGIILLESRSLEDDPFYLATNDSVITGEFNPELALTETITAITAGVEAQITSAGHGLNTGDSVYIYNTDSTDPILGAFEVTVVDIDNFTVPFTVTIDGTQGIWFKTGTTSDNDVKPNRVYYSKTSQPEAVPLLNFLDIGPQDQAIQRIIALRDNLFVLKEDGVYIITGTSAPNFGSRLLDESSQIFAPDTAVVLNNKIYCLSSQGVVAITEGGVSIVSRPIEDLITKVFTNFTGFESVSFGVSYESDRAYLLWVPSKANETFATQCFRYNTFTNTWTRWTNPATAGIVNEANDKLHIGVGDRNFVDQERKDLSREDFADRDFELTLPPNAFNDTGLEVSSFADLAKGDVLVQTQYLTISQFNRLLLKLDLDPGLDDNNYFSSLKATQGDNLKAKMDELNIKLVADDDSGIITSRVYTNDFATLQTEFNLTMDELNDTSSDPQFTNYRLSEGTTPYEVIVTEKTRTINVVVLSVPTIPFIEGPVTAFKGIQMDVLYAPQHFGASDVLKQVREGTLLFDQNNFYSAEVEYSSDRSAAFEGTEFFARAVGFWGGFDWGQTTWGGEGNEIPLRTLIPRDKQRCRHLRVRLIHVNAREVIRLLGISLEPRALSTRAYR